MTAFCYPCLTCDDFVSHVYQPKEERAKYSPKLSNLVAGTKKVPAEDEDAFKMSIFSRDKDVESEWAYWKSKRGFYSDSLQARQLYETKKDEGVDYDIFYQENQMTDIYRQIGSTTELDFSGKEDASGSDNNMMFDFNDFSDDFDSNASNFDNELDDDVDDISNLIDLYGNEKYEADQGYDRDLKLFVGEKSQDKEKRAKTEGYGARSEGHIESKPYDYSLDENSLADMKDEVLSSMTEDTLSSEEKMAEQFSKNVRQAAINQELGITSECQGGINDDEFDLDFDNDFGNDGSWSETGTNQSFGDTVNNDENDFFGGNYSYQMFKIWQI